MFYKAISNPNNTIFCVFFLKNTQNAFAFCFLQSKIESANFLFYFQLWQQIHQQETGIEMVLLEIALRFLIQKQSFGSKEMVIRVSLWTIRQVEESLKA